MFPEASHQGSSVPFRAAIAILPHSSSFRALRETLSHLPSHHLCISKSSRPKEVMFSDRIVNECHWWEVDALMYCKNVCGDLYGCVRTFLYNFPLMLIIMASQWRKCLCLNCMDLVKSHDWNHLLIALWCYHTNRPFFCQLSKNLIKGLTWLELFIRTTGIPGSLASTFAPIAKPDLILTIQISKSKQKPTWKS